MDPMLEQVLRGARLRALTSRVRLPRSGLLLTRQVYPQGFETVIEYRMQMMVCGMLVGGRCTILAENWMMARHPYGYIRVSLLDLRRAFMDRVDEIRRLHSEENNGPT